MATFEATPVAAEACLAEPAAARTRWPWIADHARLFKALADETRLGIVVQLREQGEVCQCDVAAGCSVAQPTVSHHLRILRAAGIVEAQKRGVWVYYRLNAAALDGLRRYVD